MSVQPNSAQEPKNYFSMLFLAAARQIKKLGNVVTDVWRYEKTTFLKEPPNFSRRISIIWAMLKMLPVQLLSILVGWFLFLQVEQGLDFFTMLESPFSDMRAVGNYTLRHFLFLIVAISFWSAAIWLSARIMLNLLEIKKFLPLENHLSKEPLPGDEQERIINYAQYWQRWIPRILGLFPFLIVLKGFSGIESFWPFLFFVGAGAFYFVNVVIRARLFGDAKVCTENNDKQRFPLGAVLYKDLDPQVRKIARAFFWMGGGLMVFSICFTYLFTGVGPAAIVTFSFGLFIIWASCLAYLQVRWYWPVFPFLIVWAIFCSTCNNNHYIIPNESSVPEPRLTLSKHFEGWLNDRMDSVYSGQDTVRFYLIAAEGGGIRGVDWTARVLRLLQEKDPLFYKKVYAIAGSSGGMVGASYFQAYQYGVDNDWIDPADTLKFGTLVSRDYLSRELACYLFSEVMQYVIPTPIAAWDRAKWFEGGIQEGFEKTCKDEVDSKNKTFVTRDFLSMYPQSDPFRYPALFINGTVVETGQRASYSNIILEEKYFPNTLDIHDVIGHDVQMTTAMTFCCRFPYVLPPATLRNPQHQNVANVVDAGYFENTGIKTCAEIWKGVEQIKKELDAGADSARCRKIVLKPVILFIKNGSTDLYRTNQAIPQPEEYTDLLHDWMAPPRCLLKQRDGISVNWVDYAIRSRKERGFEFYVLSLNHKVPVLLPLGWYMSHEADQEIGRQVDGLRTGRINDTFKIEKENYQSLLNLLQHQAAESTGLEYLNR